MSTFAVLKALDGTTYARLAEGDWITMEPGQTLWIDLPGFAETRDKAGGSRNVVDPTTAGTLETELQRLRIKVERERAGR